MSIDVVTALLSLGREVRSTQHVGLRRSSSQRSPVIVALGAAALLTLSSTAAADMPSSGIHLEHTDANTAGCYGLEVWNGDTLITTVPADDVDPDSGGCARNEKSALLPNGDLVFDWTLFGVGYSGFEHDTHLWVSDGTFDGTQDLVHSFHESSYGAFCDARWAVVRKTAYFGVVCARFPDSWIVATRGKADASTFQLSGGMPAVAPLAADDPAPSFPLYVAVGRRIVYVADHPTNGRELWVSDGTRDGSHLLKDIRKGPASSDIRKLKSWGRTATFAADDGMGRHKWVTDGTPSGTHKL